MEEKIRQVAYDIFIKRQNEGKPGNPDSDWFEAEKTIKTTKVKKERKSKEEKHNINS